MRSVYEFTNFHSGTLRKKLESLIQMTRKSVTALTCRTPQNRIGQCIPLNKCKEIMFLIKNKSNDLVAMRYLKNAKCSPDYESAKVCCTSSNAMNIRKIAPDTESCGLPEANIAQKVVGGENAQSGM